MLDVTFDFSGSQCINLRGLDSGLPAVLRGYGETQTLLQSIFPVRVIEDGTVYPDDLPNIFGQYQILGDGIRFIPHFPFESGVRYLATFAPRSLGLAKWSEPVLHEFSFPKEQCLTLCKVENVFPSSDVLPENLLRFYVCFASPMQNGQIEKHVSVLGPDGKAASDVLYRPPVELWDRSMQRLTLLLDPGRLKRGVGPNRELGPPLIEGLEYTLAIGSGLVNCNGSPLCDGFCKAFRVTKAVRETVALEQWKLLPPVKRNRQPLTLLFPGPLDWAMLSQYITVVSANGQSIKGEVVTGEFESSWTFVPAMTWNEGSYRVQVASGLEDVSGNNLLGPFDRPMRTTGDQIIETGIHSIPFTLA